MPEENLIPTGWYQVTKGLSQVEDKYWSYEKMAWLPITVNSRESGREIEYFAALIRKEKKKR
jgi:hypothetical protein